MKEGSALMARSPEQAPPAAIRWAVLISVSIAMFGNYYLYDSIAPLAGAARARPRIQRHPDRNAQRHLQHPKHIHGPDRRHSSRPLRHSPRRQWDSRQFVWLGPFYGGGAILRRDGPRAIALRCRRRIHDPGDHDGAGAMVQASAACLRPRSECQHRARRFLCRGSVALVGETSLRLGLAWATDHGRRLRRLVLDGGSPVLDPGACGRAALQTGPPAADRIVWSDLLRFDRSYWYVTGLCVTFYSVIFPFRSTFAIKYFQDAHGMSSRKPAR